MPWGPNTEEETQEFLRKAMASQGESPRNAFEFAVTLEAEEQLIGGCGLLSETVLWQGN